MVTPHESYSELARALGLQIGLQEGSRKATEFSSLFFKREDLHPYGSHKGRSIPIMIDEKVREGCRHFAISSSGNAALAAGLHVKKLNEKLKKRESEKKYSKENDKITLEILAGKNINSGKLQKLEKLKDEHILLSLEDRPLQALFIKTADPSIQSLRQSDSDTALTGYRALAEELSEIPNLKAVFMGTSSGTTAQALADYFIKNNSGVEIHIVQTSSCHPIADDFVENSVSKESLVNEKSVADAIVDQSALRKVTLVSLIRKTGGSGWIISNEEIRAAQDITKKNVAKNVGLAISPNSALSVAGLMQAIYTGRNWDGAVVCMICGD